jgi:thiopurine S-methyltransferase
MDAAFWIERWARQQIGFHQQHINPYLQAHWASLDVPPGSAVFVPLCGKSLDMQWLRAQGHTVIGVELSRTAVREFFIEQHIEPQVTLDGRFECWETPGYRLLCGDFFALDASDLKDAMGVFDRAALIAFPAELRERYVKHMLALVPMRAPTLLVAMTYPQQQMSGPPFSVGETEVRRLYASCHIEKLQDEDVISLGENARLRERGVDQISEQAYLIRSR